MAENQRPAVLLVDDESAVRATLGAMLAHLGYMTLPAADGAAAVEVMRRTGSAIVAAVLDVRMPGMDGPATFEALRALKPDLPCVFLSGDTGAYAVIDLRSRGAADVLAKPVGLDALGIAIGTAIGVGTPGPCEP